MKSEAQAKLFKKKGDEVYLKFQYREALIEYNRALCYVESDKLKSHLYRDRSTIYFMLKRYGMCLENIQLAKDHGYPPEKMANLNAREEKCKELMKSADYQKSNDKAASEFFKLSYEAHPKVPHFIDGIEVRSSEKYGKHLITTRDLKAGDVIAIEPFWSNFASLEEGFNHEKCSFCLRHNYLSLIPCDGCVDTMYCSETCKSQHNSLHHKVLCGEFLPTPWMEPCFRLMMAGVQEFGSFDEFHKHLKSPVKKTFFDFNEITRKNFISVACSIVASKNRQEINAQLLTNLYADSLLRCFRKFFSTLENLRDVKDCFIRMLGIYCTQSMTLEEYRTESDAMICKPGSTICAMFPIIHSCDPNVARVSFDNKMVFFLTRPVKAGEKLSTSRGSMFSTTSLEERQKFLLDCYNLKCDCIACENDYPLTENLRKIAGGHLVTFYDEKRFSVTEMIKYYKRNCTMIDKFQKNHPCYETSMMMTLNQQVLFDIATMRLKC